MKTAIIIKTDGTRIPLENTDLKSLQIAVGGLIEIVSTHDGRDMYINEEGKILDLPYNQSATLLYKYNLVDSIYGDAVVVKKG